jgi:hypothetical protein
MGRVYCVFKSHKTQEISFYYIYQLLSTLVYQEILLLVVSTYQSMTLTRNTNKNKEAVIFYQIIIFYLFTFSK